MHTCTHTHTHTHTVVSKTLDGECGEGYHEYDRYDEYSCVCDREDSEDEELQGDPGPASYECAGIYDRTGAKLPIRFHFDFDNVHDPLCEDDDEDQQGSQACGTDVVHGDYLTMDDARKVRMFADAPSVCYNNRTTCEATRTYYSVLAVFWPRKRTLSYYETHGKCNDMVAKAQACAKVNDKRGALRYLEVALACRLKHDKPLRSLDDFAALALANTPEYSIDNFAGMCV